LALDDAVPGEAFGDALTGAGEQVLYKFRLGGEALVGACEGLRIFFGDEDSRDAVHDDIGDANAKHWNKFGISVNNNWGTKNQYFLNGKETTREEAMRVAAKKQGRDISSLSFTDY
jgi:hypothetical protein